MSLEEEITINQFGQGVHSVADLLDQFTQADEHQRRARFFDLYCHVWELNLVDSDIEQALADCSVTAADATCDYLNLHRLRAGSKSMLWIPDTGNPPDGTLEKPYQLLLHLFRADYQRRFALEKENPTTWWYWDLSDTKIAQSILTRHRELVDEVYAIPSFRSEFVSLAKLLHEHMGFPQARFPKPAPEHQNQFNFLTYDEMITEFVQGSKYIRAIALLRHSLEKALSIRYRLTTDEARRLTLDVINRHSQEIYNTDFF